MTTYGKTIKSRFETFKGFGGEGRNGVPFGFEGYSYEDAVRTANNVRANMASATNTCEIRVSIEPMGNGKYQVVNTSTYYSEW